MAKLRCFTSAVVSLVLTFATCRQCAADSSLTLDGTTPAIYFRYTGQPPQDYWSLYADGTGFDLYSGISEYYPFRISPVAARNSLIATEIGVGIGTSVPQSKLHVQQQSTLGTAELVARFTIGDDVVGGLFINNASAGNGVFIPKIVGRSGGQNAAMINEAVISQDIGASPAIAYNAVKGGGGGLVTRPLVVYRNNNVAKVTIAANGAVTALSFSPTSSRSLKHDIVELDLGKARAAIRQLTPVEFIYNEDESGEKQVGFIAEDVPDLVANADRQSVPIMDIVATLTRVVKDQQQTIDGQNQINQKLRLAHDEQQRLNAEQRKLNVQLQQGAEDLKRHNDDLLKRLNALESLLQPK